MSKSWRQYLLALIVALAALPLMAADGAQNNLVTTAWLKDNLKNPDVVILDASPAPVYAAKHIPGALSYDIFTYGVQDMPPAQMEKRYQSWGISPGKKVVLYDQGGSFLATRALFSLDYYGFPTENLFVLDGGLTKWEAGGLPVTKEVPPAPAPGSFTIKKLNASVKADLPEFLTASGDTKRNALVEALDPTWHFGELLVMQRSGHIPRAIMMPSVDFFNADKTFKSPEEIRKMVDYLGIRPEQTVYSHCGGGIAASVPYFAMKFILHYPNVKLFPGSELAWLSDERDLPFWTYDEPYLMRDSKWLLFSTSRMPRMYGVTHVSILDVRPASQYEQGHVPFAVNVPAEAFRSNVANPEKLATILGGAGVNPSDEAVVVSGAGLTKDSALAFLALQQLGQKTSVFADSMDDWSHLGFDLPKAATAVGPKKGPNDPSIPPTSYPVKLSDGVVVADAKGTHGVYPKVFIASGKEVPAKAQDGKVVHVPYTDLVNANGTPKPAKDIWSVLTKAGVPRYGELIVYADDPGEAAVNYFILKMMGYPDIKVLL